ncbi:MAG: biotin/lipoyl-binding protein [Bacteroidetes bacterium]|nr:MAG: biotin/lipoyl-binding protein [Bacteroidota bacterium]
MAKRKNTLIYALVGVIVLLAAFAAWKSNQKPKGEKVIVEKVEKRTIQEIVAASGKVFPQKEVKISSDVSGEVVELYIAEGDSVVQGQLLAKIDPDAYQSQVERGTANVNSAKAQLSNAKAGIETFKAQKEQILAQLENARTIHERNEDLKRDGVISQADFEASLSTLRGLEANLRAADANIKSGEESAKAAKFSVESSQAMLKEMQTSLRRTTIFAPVSGIVSSLNVEQGERVVGTIQMQGTEMMRLANLNAMEVRVDVSENDIPSVALGNEAEIEVDAYLGRKFKGTVTQIAHSAANSAAASLTSDQVTNFEVRISINPESYQDIVSADKPYPFRPGMSATVEIKTKSVEDVLSIPIQAVTTREKDEDKGKKGPKKNNDDEEEEQDLIEVVFITTEADTVKRVEVTTGIQDDDYIQVLTGLKGEEEVVTGPYTAISRKLKEGDSVEKTSEEEFYSNDKK